MSSPILGVDPLSPRYNRATGRPIRRGAGKKVAIAGYVNSTILIEDDESDESDDSSNDPGESAAYTGEEKSHQKKQRTRKRKRTPSPTPPPCDTVMYTDELEELTDSESTVSRSRISKSGPPVTLQFNIPLGFHGPLIVKLDQALIASGAAQQMTLGNVSSKQQDISADEQQVTKANKVGFLSLPPELRNKVYRLIFVADTDLRWGNPTNFCRSGQFLSTCRTVYSEGCSILYGENTFHFERNRTTRGYFWEPVHKEIGYKDFHQFLKKIGPENLAYLRDIKLNLEDATLCSTQYLNSVEDRRYINDEYLIDCLRILRTARLRKLIVGFFGRRALQRSDIKFLSYLEQIRVDSFTASNKTHWAHINKVHADAFDRLKAAMVRKKPLYAEDQTRL